MREREFEQELDITLRELEGELEAELEPAWTTRQLIEFQSGWVFSARISGFDLRSTTSPDPDVIALHNAAADRIAREIVARINEIRLMPPNRCVFVTFTGFVDEGSESGDSTLGAERAHATSNRVQARVFALAKIRPEERRKICWNSGEAGKVAHLLDDKRLFPSTTAAGRHLNRRVVAKVWMDDCPTRRGCN